MAGGNASARERGLAAFGAKRFDDALDAAREWIAAAPDAPGPHQLAGQALARLGRPAEAAAAFEAAEERGGGPACAFNAGSAWQAAGDLTRARHALHRAAAAHVELGANALALGRALIDLGERGLAGRVLAALARRDASAHAAMQSIVRLAADDRGAACGAPAVGPPGPMAPPSSWSFVVCSIDRAKFEAVSATFATRFAGVAHEVIRIPDARSLCEGYARGLARSGGEAVVFCHDDIDLLAPDVATRLATHLTHHDIVGVAGATRVTGPAVFWAGHPWLHGWVSYRESGRTGYEVTAMSLAQPLVGDIAALDGVFIACRREAALSTGFDAATFDGFHHYDLDFSYRAHLAGRRLAVACDLGLVHMSKGSFGADWSRYAGRFRAKFPALAAPQGSPHFYAARVPGPADVLAFQRRLAELATA